MRLWRGKLRRIASIFLILCAIVAAGLIGPGGDAKAQGKQGTTQDHAIQSEVQAAAKKYGVPEKLLLAMGYVNSRWEMPPVSPYKKGNPDARGTYGVMQLAQNPSQNTLGEAAKLTGISEKKLEMNRAANIRGAAAVLSRMQGKNKPSSVEGWYRTVAKYGGGSVYADQVFQTLEQGASTKTSSGEQVRISPQPGVKPQATYSPQSGSRADYRRARWYGTNGNNYTPANRPHDLKINKIVIHVTQSSWGSAINWFKDPRAQASAHYVIRSRDGFIGQSVREHNIAWHAGNWNYNQHSIGIEHEGYVNNPKWFTNAMYHSSARLVAHLCRKYHIPINRKHIIGHYQVPGSDHTDPGRYWNWHKYMRLIRHYAGAHHRKLVYQQIVDNSSSRFQASKHWGHSHWSKLRHGSGYRFARPKSVSDPAKFYMKVPRTARYAVYAWWPADSGYNSRAPIGVKTTSGFRWVHVNQRKNGGHWVRLGTFRMPKGKARRIMVSRWTSGKGLIIADAVMIRRYR